MTAEASIEAEGSGEDAVLHARGAWRVEAAAALDARLETLEVPSAQRIQIDLSGLEALDTAGAWLLLRLERRLAGGGAEVTLHKLPPEFTPLLEQVQKRSTTAPVVPRHHRNVADALAFIGENVLDGLHTAHALLGFFGLVVVTVFRSIRQPHRIRTVSLVSHMERTGVSALPIVGLLSLLIGVVFAYQGAGQLRRFGAQIYTVDLLGVAFLRELGGLLAAIIIAGRSGSAFTAEIGSMQVNEEIDALRTLGIDPIEVLVLPRLFALMITLPLITFYANVMGLVGGALMSWATLNIPPAVFLSHLRDAIAGWTFWLGLIKAPFFAICISLIGCYEGLRVSRSAESVGRLTTRSVVESIFLVIVIDAVFSVVFAQLSI